MFIKILKLKFYSKINKEFIKLLKIIHYYLIYYILSEK
jgi:hypothetical protein